MNTPANNIIAAVNAAMTWEALDRCVPVARALLADPTAAHLRDTACASLHDAVIRLVTNAMRGNAQIFAPSALAIPIVLADANWKSPNPASLGQLRAACGKFITGANNYQTTAALLWTLLLLNGLATGPRPALAQLMMSVAENPSLAAANAWGNDSAIIGRTLAEYGWFIDRAESGGDETVANAFQRASAAIVKLDPLACEAQVLGVIRLAAFDAALPPIAWLDLVFSAFTVPVMTAVCTDSRHFRLVLTLEYIFSSNYARIVEGSERYLQLHRIWVPLIERAGAQVKRTSSWPAHDGPPRVAFLLISPQRLAHTDLLLACLRGLPPRPDRDIDYTVVILAPRGEQTRDIESRLAEVDVDMDCIDASHARELTSITSWLADYIDERRVTGLVFVSASTFLALYAAMRMAPVVVWWSMKYHGIHSDRIDGYLTSPSIFQDHLVIDGRRWRASHAALPPMTRPGAEADGQSARAALGLPPHAVVLGCFGREAKLLNPRYANALAQVLRAAPEACFLWSGRSQPPELMARFAALGIEKRCRFVGWVDTKVYAHAIDIYFDSFPFASGHTAYEAMTAGKPVVVLLTPEAEETSTATSIMPLYRGQRGPIEVQREVQRIFRGEHDQSLLPFLETEEAYVAFARRLVADPGFRKAVGAAGKAFVERFLFDYAKFAQTTSRHLLEIIEEKQRKSAIPG